MSTAIATLPPAIALRPSLASLRSLLRARRTPGRVAQPAAAAAAAFQLVEHRGAERGAVERFIRRRFAESFSAQVDAFMPRLFSAQDADGEICGAFGLRSGSGRLFLEQYLDQPIEQVITQHGGQAAARASVVEVGHFCGTQPGAMRAMIEALTQRLFAEGFEWVAFTGTTGLRNAFVRLGLHPVDVAAADVARLPVESRAAWGSYYANGPRVLVGRIGEGYRALAAEGDAQ